MEKTEARDIGINVKMPSGKCNDMNCPFHGSLSLRGRRFTGTVISSKMRKTALVEFPRLHFIKKYERYEKRRTKLKAHNPECVTAMEGDIVNLMECRPLSKTKNFVIVQRLGAEKGFKGKMEAREAAKVETKREDGEEVKAENE